MPSLLSQDCSPNSLANIVIFQTNALFVDIFSSDDSLPFRQLTLGYYQEF
jgi:hypothetical protein